MLNDHLAGDDRQKERGFCSGPKAIPDQICGLSEDESRKIQRPGRCIDPGKTSRVVIVGRVSNRIENAAIEDEAWASPSEPLPEGFLPLARQCSPLRWPRCPRTRDGALL